MAWVKADFEAAQKEDQRLRARIRELEDKNAALQESALAKANDIISRKNAALREALGAAEKEIIPARNYLTASAKFRPKEKRAKAEEELGHNLNEVCRTIEAALKGV